MLKKFDLMSVNQINTQIKLLEIWKSLKLNNYPLQVEQQSPKTETISTRACTIGRLCEVGKSDILQKTCISDAIKLWNRAPAVITTSESLWKAKKEIKKICKKTPNLNIELGTSRNSYAT